MIVISSEARNLKPWQHVKISPVGRNDSISYFNAEANSEIPQQDLIKYDTRREVHQS